MLLLLTLVACLRAACATRSLRTPSWGNWGRSLNAAAPTGSAAPTGFALSPGPFLAGRSVQVTLSGGGPRAREDKVAVLAAAYECGAAAALTGVSLTHLISANTTNDTATVAALLPGAAGAYKLCFREYGVNTTFVAVGSATFDVLAVSPQKFTTSADPKTGTTTTLTLGGASDTASGLITGSTGDQVKIIAADAADCTAAAAGGAAASARAAPSGNGEADGTDKTEVRAEFTFTTAGSYKVCYKAAAAGAQWAAVGSLAFDVRAIAPSRWSSSDSAKSRTAAPIALTFSGGSGLQ